MKDIEGYLEAPDPPAADAPSVPTTVDRAIFQVELDKLREGMRSQQKASADGGITDAQRADIQFSRAA